MVCSVVCLFLCACLFARVIVSFSRYDWLFFVFVRVCVCACVLVCSMGHLFVCLLCDRLA